jgi:glucose-1-phosphate cytidylyltransferase
MRASGESVPKPLVEIGDRPILWHVMSLYAAQGRTRFLLLLGFGAAGIRAFVDGLPQSWEVACVDTGVETPTGGRVARARELLDGGPFHLTYADGLADVDLHALEAFHRERGGAATMTVVQPRNPWGVARLDDAGRVAGFEEKPPLDAWVNGGFLVMEPAALDVIGPDDVLERGPLEALSERGALFAYRHRGFWDCMDTYKDTLALNELWDRGEAPWLMEGRR